MVVFFKNERSVLPGFGLTMGLTLLSLTLVVLIPLSALFVKSASLGGPGFWAVVSTARVWASLKLTFGLSLGAALFNALFGTLVAWVLVRYSFPGKKIVDGLVDLPFALPTAVAGITLTTLYSRNGWLGAPLKSLGLDVVYQPLGIWVALTFIGLPFVVRTVQPVLEAMDQDMEEAATTLGASRWQTLRYAVFPVMFPSIVTGFTLAFARALGEYGSVVFISGNMPLKTEITPLLIMTKLEQFDYAGAAAIAVIMLSMAFLLIFVINALQWWHRQRQGVI
ncbi:MAG: Sulfate transport system permease protein CysT [Elusimicrobia bacterium]|nr:Sulfate transport system permease protein CysT [Elusimicrobiota bacterium]